MAFVCRYQNSLAVLQTRKAKKENLKTRDMTLNYKVAKPESCLTRKLSN